MGKYLEIAKKALSAHADSIAEVRISTEDQSPDAVTPGQCEISEIGEKSPQNAYRDFEATDRELQTILGDEWDDIKGDPAQRETMRRCVTEARQIEQGILPHAYTCVTDCKFCGPVYVYPGYPNQSNNCPWCFNRIKGLPIRRAQEYEPVTGRRDR